MQNSLPACLTYLSFISFLLASMPATLRAQELLGNGDFEAGRLPPWDVNQVPGSSVALAPESSPFHSVYAAGSASVRLKDDDSSDFLDQPSIRQQFGGVPEILFGFDFKVINAGDASPWYVAWYGENATTGFFFSLGGTDGLSLEFNQQKIADLKSDVWYHIEGFADAPNQTVEGSVSDTLGDHADFQGGFPFGVKSELNAVVVSDGDAARNPDILLDNFYSRPVTLQISVNSKGQQVVTWIDTSFTLQSSATLGSGAQWTSIPDVTGSYTNTFSDPIRFFRLMR